MHSAMAAFWSGAAIMRHWLRSTARAQRAPRRCRRRKRARAVPRRALAQPAGPRSRRGSVTAAARLLHAWLEIERLRPPFTVAGHRSERDGGSCVVDASGCRSDRVDALADGGIAIIDFKTGTRRASGKLVRPAPARDAAGDVRARAARCASRTSMFAPPRTRSCVPMQSSRWGLRRMRAHGRR